LKVAARKLHKAATSSTSSTSTSDHLILSFSSTCHLPRFAGRLDICTSKCQSQQLAHICKEANTQWRLQC
jgi:hypothetical protein